MKLPLAVAPMVVTNLPQAAMETELGKTSVLVDNVNSLPKHLLLDQNILYIKSNRKMSIIVRIFDVFLKINSTIFLFVLI